MNIPYGPNDLPDSDALDLQIDELCDEYEAAVRAGKPRRMEDYLTRVAASTQGRLLTELILGELEIRRGRGETPAMEEYVRQFPQYQTEIEEAFSQDNVEIAAKSPGGPSPGYGRLMAGPREPVHEDLLAVRFLRQLFGSVVFLST